MHQVLLFESLDPWQMDLRRDSRGRFAGGGGGGGRGGGGGTKKMKFSGVHTQKVKGISSSGQIRRSQVQSRRIGLPGKKNTTYTYKVTKGGYVAAKAPRQLAAIYTKNPVGRYLPKGLERRLRPGSPIAGNKNFRYIQRAHFAGRVTGFGDPKGIGRAMSARTARAFVKKGKPLKPGYVVSYGKPIPTSSVG